jgi:hypothetical protein
MSSQVFSTARAQRLARFNLFPLLLMKFIRRHVLRVKKKKAKENAEEMPEIFSIDPATESVAGKKATAEVRRVSEASPLRWQPVVRLR